MSCELAASHVKAMKTKIGKTLEFVKINLESVISGSGANLPDRNSLDNALDAVSAMLEDLEAVEKAEDVKTKWLQTTP